MKITFSQKINPSFLTIIPVWEGGKKGSDDRLGLEPDLTYFQGKLGDTAFSQKALFMGLGPEEKKSKESLRRGVAAAIKAVNGKNIEAVNLYFPKHSAKEKELFITGIVEGAILSNYSFLYRKEKGTLLKTINFIGIERSPHIDKIETICEGIHFVRDWVNQNADDKNPKAIADMAKKLHPKVQTTILDKKKLIEEKMGLLLAVNRGSDFDPFLVCASYKGNPKSENHTVIIGKGVTYDTGGLSLKTTEHMLTMKCDMAGAAAALGAVKTAAELGLKVNVTAVTPLTENCIDAKSYKIGDVYTSYSGKTVEINNTDAEGRLILADAISYVVKNLKPTQIIDLASLTGACVVALGEDIAGLFSNNEQLANDLLQSSASTDELLWRFPIHSDYMESYKSDIADLVNSGGREAGAIKGALFLQEFVRNIPWAHIDLAGPCFLNKAKHYHPSRATGYGLKLLIDYLENKQ